LRAAPGQLGVALRAWAHHERRRVLLFIDPFEELYTLCAEPDERAAFLACLDGVADDASSPLRVLLSIRSDFLDRLAEHRHLADAIGHGLMLVPRSTATGCATPWQAAEKPESRDRHDDRIPRCRRSCATSGR
jgi:hypothetical protein